MAGTMTIAELLVRIGVQIDDAKKAQDSVDALRKSTDKLGKEGQRDVSDLGRTFTGLGQKIRGALTSARASVGGLVDSMGGLKTIAIAGGAAIAGAAVGIFKFVESNAEAVGSLKDLAASTGVEVEELQRLKFAASQSGVEAEQLGVALKTLNKNLLDAKTGGGDAFKETLAQIGLNLEDLEGLSRTQQIGLIGDKLNLIGDAGERSARAADIFGMRAGPALASLLAEGTAGIDALAASTKGIFTAEQVAAAEEFGDEVAAAKAEVTAMAREMAMELLPSVRDGLDSFREWIAENDQLIHQDIPGFMREVGGTIREAGESMAVLVTWTDELESAFDGLSRVAGATNPILDIGAALQVAAAPAFALVAAIDELNQELIRMGIITATMKGGTDADIAKRKGKFDSFKRSVDKTARETARGAPVRTGTTTVENVGGGRHQRSVGGGGAGGFDTGSLGGAGALFGRLGGLVARGGGAPTAPTLDALVGSLFGGPQGSAFSQLAAFGRGAPRLEAQSPTVSIEMNITNNEVNVAAGAIAVTAPDAPGAGRSAVAEIKKLIGSSAQGIGTTVLR